MMQPESSLLHSGGGQRGGAQGTANSYNAEAQAGARDGNVAQLPNGGGVQ